MRFYLETSVVETAVLFTSDSILLDVPYVLGAVIVTAALFFIVFF